MKRVGIVGCGGIAQVHVLSLQRIRDCNDCTIVALCDSLPGRAEAFAKENGIGDAAVYTDFHELVQSKTVDVVHICTPHHLHVPMACQAMRNGISVFMEKPVAITSAQLEELQKETQKAAQRGVFFGACFQNRYNASTRKLDALVASGTYGKVLGGRAVVTWKRDASYYTQSEWKGRWETEGGGALINQSIHTLDLLLHYLGAPSRVEAVLANHHTHTFVEVEDTVELWMEFADGKRGCFYASNGYVTDAPVWLELECEKARLTLLDGCIYAQTKEEVCLLFSKKEKGIGKDYWGSGHLACIQDFYDCMDTKKKFRNDLDNVLVTAETVLKIYEKGKEQIWNS